MKRPISRSLVVGTDLPIPSTSSIQMHLGIPFLFVSCRLHKFPGAHKKKHKIYSNYAWFVFTYAKLFKTRRVALELCFWRHNGIFHACGTFLHCIKKTLLFLSNKTNLLNTNFRIQISYGVQPVPAVEFGFSYDFYIENYSNFLIPTFILKMYFDFFF